MESIVDGYHTAKNLGTKESIEKKAPFFCSSKDAWLGTGYYYWDRDINLAHEWGKNFCDNNYVIVHNKLNLVNCFDLVGTPDHKKTLLKIKNEFIAKGKLNENDIKISVLIEYLRQNDLFPFLTIRAEDRYREKTKFVKNKHEFTFLDSRIQICVINKTKVLLTPSTVIEVINK